MSSGGKADNQSRNAGGGPVPALEKIQLLGFQDRNPRNWTLTLLREFESKLRSVRDETGC